MHTVVILQGIEIQAYMIGQIIGAVIGVIGLVWLWKKDDKERKAKMKKLRGKRYVD
jgi:glycerol uptake facilitator-like aquaporin